MLHGQQSIKVLVTPKVLCFFLCRRKERRAVSSEVRPKHWTPVTTIPTHNLCTWFPWTRSPCFKPRLFYAFCFNTPYLYTPLLNLRHLSLDLTPLAAALCHADSLIYSIISYGNIFIYAFLFHTHFLRNTFRVTSAWCIVCNICNPNLEHYCCIRLETLTV
jgi:uncharacterized membrane protein